MLLFYHCTHLQQSLFSLGSGQLLLLVLLGTGGYRRVLSPQFQRGAVARGQTFQLQLEGNVAKDSAIIDTLSRASRSLNLTALGADAAVDVVVVEGGCGCGRSAEQEGERYAADAKS